MSSRPSRSPDDRILRLCGPELDRLPVAPLPEMDAPLPDDAHPKPLAWHRRGECLWPLGAARTAGDWRTLFCCAPVGVGRRYCPSHAALAFRAEPEAANDRGEQR